jgi:hypothetical protein
LEREPREVEEIYEVDEDGVEWGHVGSLAKRQDEDAEDDSDGLEVSSSDDGGDEGGTCSLVFLGCI